MAWSRRSHRAVPSDWKSAIRPRILVRDNGICHVCGHAGADDVDHKRNVAAGGTHDDANLGLIHSGECPTCGRKCHKDKTQAEAAAARAAMRAAARHPREQHPGLA